MNIDFYITEEKKRSGIHLVAVTPKTVYNLRSGVFGFIRLCWRLWKWYNNVKKQARRARMLRETDRDMYVFRTRQTFRIETEN